MKRLFITMAGLALLTLPVTSHAVLSGSPHDMSQYTGGGVGGTLGVGQDQLCFGCHIPHGAQGDKLWTMDTTGSAAGMSTVQRLCYTCHDGTISVLYDAFDMSDGLVDHISPGGADCSGDNACHDVHDQPAADAKFLVEGVGTNGSLCENCHDGTPHPSWSGGDRTAAGNHLIGTAAGGLTCEDCHGAHTGVAQGDGNDSYILKVDNAPVGGQWGQACISCHNNQAPYAGFVTDIYNYSETVVDGTEAKHPTYGGTYTLTGCNECHTVHGTDDYGYLLNAPTAGAPTFIDFCTSCHTDVGISAPGVGTATHYTGDVSLWSGDPGALPWANTINDDGTAGNDWSTAPTNWMVCETCHSVHKNGNPGYFTRIAQTDQNELCTTSCHDQP